MSLTAHSDDAPVWALTVAFAIENIYANTEAALLLIAWPVITLAGIVYGGVWLWLVIAMHIALWLGCYRVVKTERLDS